MIPPSASTTSTPAALQAPPPRKLCCLVACATLFAAGLASAMCAVRLAMLHPSGGYSAAAASLVLLGLVLMIASAVCGFAFVTVPYLSRAGAGGGELRRPLIAVPNGAAATGRRSVLGGGVSDLGRDRVLLNDGVQAEGIGAGNSRG